MEEGLSRGSAGVVNAQREIALLRSSFGIGMWTAKLGGGIIGDARAWLQYGEVTKVTELTTVV